METGRDAIDTPPAGRQFAVPVFAGREQALAWFAGEHHALIALVGLAAATGSHEHTWRLGLALAGYLDNQGHWPDWIAGRWP